MDKEQARFILRCFRPDGADAMNPDFEGALRMAAEDRELGEWLARERAHDATFGEALASVPLPCDLRGAILAGLAAERGEIPQTADPADRLLADALASVRPPAGLREDVLVAMRRSAGIGPRRKIAWPYWAAAAAGVAAAFLAVRPSAPAGRLVRNDPGMFAPAASGSLAIEAVKVGFIKEAESPSFSLDLKKPDQLAMFEHLKQRSLPCPCCMPPGLVGVPGIGCRELIIDGHRGSVLCFKESEGGVVHLVVFRGGDIRGDFPERDHPQMGQCGGWATASWKHEGQVFVLMGKTDPKKLASLF
jgi:hypothetical protein